MSLLTLNYYLDTGTALRYGYRVGVSRLGSGLGVRAFQSGIRWRICSGVSGTGFVAVEARIINPTANTKHSASHTMITVFPFFSTMGSVMLVCRFRGT